LSDNKETSEEIFEENKEDVTSKEEDMVSLKKTAEVVSDDTIDNDDKDVEASSDEEEAKGDESSEDSDEEESDDTSEDVSEDKDSDDEVSEDSGEDSDDDKSESSDDEIDEDDIDHDLLASDEINKELETESIEQIKSDNKSNDKKSKFKKIWFNSQDELDNKKEKSIANILSYVKIIAVAFVLAYLINTFVLSNTTIPSSSMENTIMKNDRLFGFRWAYTFSAPKRGDIIIFKYPDNEKENYIKRVIGLPKDKVEIKSGAVYVNNEKIEEDYLKEAPIEKDFGPYNVPEDSYFVLGDNRNCSKDARYWKNTYVHKDQIVAKAIFKYFPKIEFM